MIIAGDEAPGPERSITPLRYLTPGGTSRGRDAPEKNEGPGSPNLVRPEPAEAVRAVPGLRHRRTYVATGFPRPDPGHAIEVVSSQLVLSLRRLCGVSTASKDFPGRKWLVPIVP